MLCRDAATQNEKMGKNEGVFVATSTAPAGGQGLFAAKPFVAGQTIVTLGGIFYTPDKLRRHPRRDRIQAYSIGAVSPYRTLGVLSPLDEACIHVSQSWGFANEPPVLNIRELRPEVWSELKATCSDAHGQHLVRLLEEVHIHTNALLHAVPSRKGVDKDGLYGLTIRAARSIGVGEEIFFT